MSWQRLTDGSQVARRGKQFQYRGQMATATATATATGACGRSGCQELWEHWAHREVWPPVVG